MRRFVVLGLVLVGVLVGGCAALAGRWPFGGCPPPADWRLVAMEGSRLSRLEPDCARESLERATAVLAARLAGYRPEEAQKALGVAVRFRPLNEKVDVELPTGPFSLTVGGLNGFLASDYRVWDTFTAWAPVGCFAPTGRLGGYRVLCWTAGVAARGESFAVLGDLKVRRLHPDPLEVWTLWGHDGEAWTLLGGGATVDPPADVSARVAELRAWAQAFGGRVLDHEALSRYRLAPQVPPADASRWAADEATYRAFLTALKAK